MIRAGRQGRGNEGHSRQRAAHGQTFLPDMGEILIDGSAVSFLMWLKHVHLLMAGPWFVLGPPPGGIISMVLLTLEPGNI